MTLRTPFFWYKAQAPPRVLPPALQSLQVQLRLPPSLSDVLLTAAGDVARAPK
jgi:hypothetical protein